VPQNIFEFLKRGGYRNLMGKVALQAFLHGNSVIIFHWAGRRGALS
jgi:hypothetical protein